MSDETLFGWVHISDIHFGHGDASHGWDQKSVLAELRRDIARNAAQGRVDAILVTGDVAFSGAGRSPTEYEDARRWLLDVAKAAGVGPHQVFLVPGNHDVNRAVDDHDAPTGQLIKALRSRTTPSMPLDNAMRDAGDRELLAGRMAAYLELAKDFGPWVGSNPLPRAVDRLFWVHSIDAGNGLRVRFIGLNTALLCKDDDDKGQLVLGAEQIARVLTDDPVPGELIVVLTHHPLRKGWLADDDRADAFVRDHAHVHLSGHVHEAYDEGARSGAGGSFVRVTAGAAHNEQLPLWIPATHGYNFAGVRRGARGAAALRIRPRTWSPQQARFVLDVNCVPEGAIWSEHELRVALPEASTAARATGAARAPQAGPVRVFLSYAPEDDALRKKLEKHLSLLRRSGIVESFTSHSVGAGEAWQGVVDQHLAEAQVILLLLSNDYLASDYCYDVEMEAARERYVAGDALVIPVILRDVDLRKQDELKRAELWFEKLARVPVKAGEERGKPVTSWANEDEAWTEVARAIRAAVNKVRGTGG